MGMLSLWSKPGNKIRAPNHYQILDNNPILTPDVSTAGHSSWGMRITLNTVVLIPTSHFVLFGSWYSSRAAYGKSPKTTPLRTYFLSVTLISTWIWISAGSTLTQEYSESIDFHVPRSIKSPRETCTQPPQQCQSMKMKLAYPPSQEHSKMHISSGVTIQPSLSCKTRLFNPISIES